MKLPNKLLVYAFCSNCSGEHKTNDCINSKASLGLVDTGLFVQHPERPLARLSNSL